MTSHRILFWLVPASVAALGVAGCAAVPIFNGDLCSDAGCNLPQADGGLADGFIAMSDAGPSPDAALEVPARASLCSSTNTCKQPDDPTNCTNTTDGGAPMSDDASVEACRVGSDDKLACTIAGTGENGASCTSASDCAPGYECVGAGTCRHYCCDDMACAVLGQQSSQSFFCDVDVEKAAPTVSVPVCFEVQKCQPLGMNSCGMGQACTLVEINNGLELVATCDLAGNGVAGDSCETAHCADGYACIGSIGTRTCQQLCDYTHPCSGSLTCDMKSSGSFNVGICGYY